MSAHRTPTLIALGLLAALGCASDDGRPPPAPPSHAFAGEMHEADGGVDAATGEAISDAAAQLPPPGSCH